MNFRETSISRRILWTAASWPSVKDAFKSLPLPPLGSVEHNCVHLLPIYKTVLKREKLQTREMKEWTEESVMSLQE